MSEPTVRKINNAQAPNLGGRAIKSSYEPVVYVRNVIGEGPGFSVYPTHRGTAAIVFTGRQINFQQEVRNAILLDDLGIGPRFLGVIENIPNLPQSQTLAFEVELLDKNQGWVDDQFLDNHENLFKLPDGIRERIVAQTYEKYAKLRQAGYDQSDTQWMLNTITGEVLIADAGSVAALNERPGHNAVDLKFNRCLLAMVKGSRAVDSARQKYLSSVKRSQPSVVVSNEIAPMTFVSQTQANLSAGKPASWLMINFSGIKKVNDDFTGGHKAGNALIAVIENKIQAIFGKNAFIMRDGTTFSVFIEQDSDKQALLRRCQAEFDQGIEFETVLPEGKIKQVYSRETTQRENLFRAGILTYAKDVKLSAEAMGISRGLQVFYLNRPNNPRAGARIGQEYVIGKAMEQYLKSMTVDEGHVNPYPRVTGNGAYIEKRSGLNNVLQLEQDGTMLLATGKSLRYGFMDLNATSKHRCAEEAGDRMINMIMERRIAEAATVLPKEITIHRHGGASEEFYFLADADLISEEQMIEALKSFLKALNDLPLLMKVLRNELESNETGRRYLRNIKDNGVEEIINVDITRYIRGWEGDYNRGITGTLGVGTIHPNPTLPVREAFERQRYHITAHGEAAKKINPKRHNMIVAVDKDGMKVIPLPSPIKDPVPIEDSREAGRLFLEENIKKIRFVDNGPGLPFYSIEQLLENNLEPREGFIYKDKIYRVSASFEFRGRKAMVLYYSHGNGQYFTRLVYKSNTHMTWRTPSFWRADLLGKGEHIENSVEYPFEVMQFMEESAKEHKIELDGAKAWDLARSICTFAGNKQTFIGSSRSAIKIGKFKGKSPKSFRFEPGFELDLKTMSRPFKVKDEKTKKMLDSYMVQSRNRVAAYLFQVDEKGNCSMNYQVNEFVPNDYGVNQLQASKDTERLAMPLHERAEIIPEGFAGENQEYSAAYWTNQLPPVNEFLKHLGITPPLVPFSLVPTREEIAGLQKGLILVKEVRGKEFFVVRHGKGEYVAYVLPPNLHISAVGNIIVVSDQDRQKMMMRYQNSSQLIKDLKAETILGYAVEIIKL